MRLLIPSKRQCIASFHAQILLLIGTKVKLAVKTTFVTVQKGRDHKYETLIELEMLPKITWQQLKKVPLPPLPIFTAAKRFFGIEGAEED